MYFLSSIGFVIAFFLFFKNIYDACNEIINMDESKKSNYCNEILAQDPNFELKIIVVIFIIVIIYILKKALFNNNSILSVIVCLLTFYLAISGKKIIYAIVKTKNVYTNYLEKFQDTGSFGSKFSLKIKTFIMILCLFIFPFCPIRNQIIMNILFLAWDGAFFYIPTYIGEIIAYVKVKKDNKKINNINKDIYLRELPNNFGIGVNSLLIDSKIENSKDLVAVILDLCAKKYLSIKKVNDKYELKVLKNSDNDLLSNEKYILDNIINNNVRNIDYTEWYNYCVNDGINLNLYIPGKKKESLFKQANDFFANFFKEAFKNPITGLVMIYILSPLILFLLVFYLAFRIYLFPITIVKSYNKILSGNLKRTDNGVVEYHKLMAFRKFIKDFGAFANREAKEVVIWDRYLSYAQVFGLTKEIMQTGYNDIVNNASFQIDNIDNISLDNIEVLI